MTVDRRWLLAWARRYDAGYDEKHGVAALARTMPTYDNVRRIVRWKSARSLGYFDRNSHDSVAPVVSDALAQHDPCDALQRLTELAGVRERVASAILAVYDPRRYTVMDRRAYATLVANGELQDLSGWTWAQTWRPYLNVCSAIARRERLSKRTVDRALYAANGRTDLPARAQP